MKKKKKMIIAAVIVVVIVIIAVLLAQNNARVQAAMAESAVETKELSTMTLANTVDVTGTVESLDTVKVYSSLATMQVKTIYVSEGDEVQAGDVLCELDTENLDKDIAQSEATIAASSDSAGQQILSSEQKYENAVNNLNNGLNAQVESAKAAVATTTTALNTAQSNYDAAAGSSQKVAMDAAKSQLDACQTAYNTAANNDLNGIAAAQNAVQQAQEALTNLENQHNAGLIDDATYFSQKTVLDTNLANANTQLATVTGTANAAIAQAQSNLTTAQTAYDAAYQVYYAYAYPLQKALDSAKDAYDQAIKQRDIVINSANQEIEAYKSAVDSSQVAANTEAQEIALEKLKTQKEQSVIKAPVAGTVTGVNAVEGTAPTGALFVIENTEGLQIATTIKEYDVNNVKQGMKATISADGTGDDVYEGTLRSIAPAAATTTSSTLTTTAATGSSDVAFDAVVDVVSEDTGLLIGMNARVSIILEEKENVLAVPYDAVTEDETGAAIVYAAQKNEKGIMTYQKVNVQTGLETDFYIEISGKDLQEGMLIVTNPDKIPAMNGSPVAVNG